MKRLLLIALLCLPLPALATADSSLVYILNLDGNINAKTERLLEKAMEQAQKKDASAFLLHLNTYGGDLNSADKMRTMLLETEMTTVAFVDHQAASAGALISLACDSIYMSAFSSIGSATVVNQKGEPMPEKYQSFMRSIMRATAQATGRDPQLAANMVTGDTIVNLTTAEAIAVGLCAGQKESVEQAADAVISSDTCVIESYKETLLDKIIGFFLLPLVQGLLLMGIMGGIFLEFKTPGIGLPLVVAVLCAVGYFSPLFLEGLAQYWEIVLVVVGIILLLLEVFVTPGFGVLGIMGAIAVFVGLILAMVDNVVFHAPGPFNWNALVHPMAVVSTAAFLSVLGFILLLNRLFPTKLFNHIALRTNLEVKEGFVGVPLYNGIQIGDIGVAVTPLHPGGKVAISIKPQDGTAIEEGKSPEQRWVEARAAVGYIEPKTPVRVVRLENGTVWVEANNSPFGN